MKKGQMSLEMIIGLLILLVVAVVVIRMFLKSLGTDPIKPPEDTLKFIEFKGTCESLCTNFLNYGTKASLANYCSERLKGLDDLNNNGVLDNLEAATLSIKICEDAIYCFQIVPCETSTGMISWEQCRQAICNAKYEVYKDWDKADQKVLETIPGPGSCSLPQDENWWNLYFGPKPCTNPGFTGNQVTSTTDAPVEGSFNIELGGCTIYSGGWTFSCEILSKNGECSNQMVAVPLDPNDMNNALIASSGVNNIGEIIFADSNLNGLLQLNGNSPSLGICNLGFICDKNGNDEIDDGETYMASSCQIV